MGARFSQVPESQGHLSWSPAEAQPKEPHLGIGGSWFFTEDYGWRAEMDKVLEPLADCPGGLRDSRGRSVCPERGRGLRRLLAPPHPPGVRSGHSLWIRSVTDASYVGSSPSQDLGQVSGTVPILRLIHWQPGSHIFILLDEGEPESHRP